MDATKQTNGTGSDNTGTNAGDPMTKQTGTAGNGTAEKPRKGKKVPPSALEMLAALYGVSVKELGEQAAEHEEPDGDEGDEDKQLPPGATVLCAFKELCDSAIPMTEETNVKKFLERTLTEANKTAFKAYPELDLGFEPIEEEEDDEEDDDKEFEDDEDDDEEEKDADEDDEDEDDEDDDEDEEKQLERLQSRFSKITGVTF